MKSLLTPKFLHKGDLIDLVAPSFGCTSDPYSSRLEASIKRLKKEGFRIQEGVNIRLNEGVAASNSGEKRAKEFMDAYADPDSSLLLSVGGGELMNEILPYIDFRAIETLSPKWFMGFSDNTNLTFLLPTLSGVKAIYGPNAPSFYERKFRFAQKDALSLLMGETHFEGYPKYYGKSNRDWPPLYAPRANKEKIIVNKGFASPVEGVLLGGCLDILVNLVGTKFDEVTSFIKSQPGIIWFFEACDLSPLSIRRGLFQLKEAGWFDTAAAFLFGRHLCSVFPHNDLFGVNPHNASDILDDYHLPTLLDIDLGHLGPSMPLIVGEKAKVSLVEGNIHIDYIR